MKQITRTATLIYGHGPGTGPAMRGQGPSLDINGNIVPNNTSAAHWLLTGGSN